MAGRARIPPHGIRLEREGKFVVTRHFPDERALIAVSLMAMKVTP